MRMASRRGRAVAKLLLSVEGEGKASGWIE